ncbi:MAG: Uma2 family endonuclease [Planctomycetota bacterium]
MTPDSSSLARPRDMPRDLPRDLVGPEDYDESGRFLYPGEVEDAMPEGFVSWWLGVYLVQALTRLLADPARCSVHANMPIYYAQGQPKRHVSPDAFFLRGVPFDRERRSYCLWKTGVVPQVVFEVLSRHHEHKDEVTNRGIYAALGVPEYYWFDPDREVLTALRLTADGRYEAAVSDAQGRYASPALGLELGLHEGMLALYQDGAYVEPSEDLLARQQRMLAEQREALAEQREALADKDRQLREALAELERLRRERGES